MTTTDLIVPERLAALDTIDLHSGYHGDWNLGHCAMEVVDWLTGGDGTRDMPPCVDPTIAKFVQAWNDGLPDVESRNRLLRPLLPKMAGTANQGLSERRSFMALDWLTRTHTVAWLRLADLTKEADRIAALPEIVDAVSAAAAGPVVRDAREAALGAAWEAAWEEAWEEGLAAAGDAGQAAAWAAEGAAWAAARAADGAARAAAGAAAWEAAQAAAREAAEDAARAAAWNPADAVAATVSQLQVSASDLLIRMCDLEAPADDTRRDDR